ncbi:glycosyltransferase family 4 protein [Pseudooceanicola sediminis]|nr:glycosyltransferase family 4 protein [Pseudooceanicola sediminis]
MHLMSRPHRSRPRIAIVDPCCGAPYDPLSLTRGGLGGTEATVLRVCATLTRDFEVRHYQATRREPLATSAGLMLPLSAGPAGADVIIVLNTWKVAVKLRKLHPEAAILLWLHIRPGRHNRKMGPALHAAGVRIICVSRSHMDWLRAFLGDGALPRTGFIYNPIADTLAPDATRRDPNRLLFASSPHKGLAEVFGRFDALRAVLPDLTLAVADPGYLRWNTGPVPKNVRFLGTLSHGALMRQMRRALCLFMPQTSFAETFGLVMAEANAVGTPVLASAALGANEEVLTPGQYLSTLDTAHLAQVIQRWQTTPPDVQANPQFRLRNVAAQWSQLLHETALCPQRAVTA